MRIISDDSRELIAADEGLTSAEELPRTALKEAQHINMAFNALPDLHGLEPAIQLRNLNVSDNAITSLLGIDCFQQLRRLRCNNNQISDLSPLQSLPNLEELWINSNQIERAQIAHLTSIKSLRVLVLHPNPCTDEIDYALFVIKQVPWITRLDRTIVDNVLRERSQHVDERESLNSAPSNISEISLMTARSIEDTLEVVKPVEPKPTVVPPSTSTPDKQQAPKKKSKKTAEDFLRAFPVQDFIPPSQDTSSPPSSVLADVPRKEDLAQTTLVEHAEEEPNQVEAAPATETTKATIVSPAMELLDAGRSTILSAVMDLPFANRNAATKKKKLDRSVEKLKPIQKTPTTKAAAPPSTPDPALPSFNQKELVITYPNSTVNAVQIRGDGSAIAKWPGGTVAVSIDRERDGFRCYAAHKDGTIALSFDASGVGFINYYPSGRMMISTSAGCDGLYFSSDGFTILRQWSGGQLKDDKGASVETLSDSEPDGSLVVKISDGLGVRVQLRRDQAHAGTCPIQVKIYFSSGTGIRHVFCNWINTSEPNGTACDALFGKALAKPQKKGKTSDAPRPSLTETLSSIRAAVAGLG